MGVKIKMGNENMQSRLKLTFQRLLINGHSKLV